MPLCGAPGKAQSVVGTQLIVAVPWRRIVATFLDFCFTRLTILAYIFEIATFLFFFIGSRPSETNIKD